MSDSRSAPPNEPQLIYFADPMCSWCWGFAPVMTQVQKEYPELPVRLVLGGLRPFTEEPMDDDRKAATRQHWTHVEEASGQPFDHAFFERESFVYDTEPAARAVVAGRRLQPSRTFDLNERIARAFYAENRDVTDPSVLGDLAVDSGFDREAFAAELESDDAKAETLGDFRMSQQSGVTGFPTLIAGPQPDGTYVLLTSGYQPSEAILDRVGTWMQHRAVAAE